MKYNRKNHISLFGKLMIFLILTLIVGIACNHRQTVKQIKVPDFIKTAKVTRRNFVREIKGFGYVRAKQKRDIVANDKGLIEKIWIKEGSKVLEGDKLILIKGEISKLEMALLKKELEISEAELNLHRKEYERIKKIQKTGGSNKKEVEKSYARYKEALSAYDAAKEQYDFYTKGIIITSHLNGYVISLHKFPGDYVQPDDLLISIADLRKLVVEVNIFGNESDLIKIGQLARIEQDGKQIKGKVSFVSPKINSDTGGRKVGIDIIENGNTGLLIGEFVEVNIIVEHHLSKLAIPEEALLTDENNKVVIIKEGKSYKKQIINIGLVNQGYIEVLKGLKEGEEVVTAGAYEIFNQDISKKFKVED